MVDFKNSRITEQCLRDLLDLAMINDSTTENVIGLTWFKTNLDEYCKRIGYTDWISAYHEVPND